MMNRIVTTTLLLSALALASCQKEPVASFTTDKNSYMTGEKVILTNTSTDGHSYIWTLPDGTQSTSENVSYTLDWWDVGTTSFKLSAYSKNGKKFDSMMKTVTVEEATGDAIFWQSTGSGFGVTSVDLYSMTASVTAEHSSAPTCGTSGAANFSDIPPGSYYYYASDSFNSWSGYVTIEENTCTAVLLN